MTPPIETCRHCGQTRTDGHYGEGLGLTCKSDLHRHFEPGPTHDQALALIDKLTEERDAERLRYGQERARVAVFMQAMAELHRRVQGAQFAQDVVKRADEAAANVRLEDFVEAKTNKGEDR